MGDIEEMTYPDMLNRFRERRNESKILLPLMSNVGQSFDSFKTAQTCLCVGPGPGEYDLEFAKRCLPNLKKIVAVEKDHYCAEELKKNINKNFNDTLSSQVYEDDIETWQYIPSENDSIKNKTFDVVVMFHMLYDVHPQTRKTVLRNALEKWIDPDKGIVVIIHMSDELDEDKRKINILQNFHRYFSDRMKLLLESDDIRQNLKEIGGKVVWSQKYKCDMDFRVYGADMTQMFNIYSEKRIDSDTIKAALKAITPNGMGTYVGEILIIRKE